MITENEYLEAQKIVDAYKEQLRIADVMRSKLLQEEREKKYKWCEENGGHEYREDTYKWGSTTRVSCISCGKTID